MAKTKKKKTAKEQKPTFLSEFSIDKFIPQKYQTAALIGIILVIFLIFFAPMYFGGKTFESGDIITSQSSTNYVNKDREGYSLWFPHIFCGMPAHPIALEFPWFNFIPGAVTLVRNAFISIFSVEYAQWTVYLILMCINSFLFVRYLTKDNLIGLFAGLSTSFCTGLIFFIFVGHITKLVSLSFFPLLLLYLLKFKSEKGLMNFIILTITVLFTLQGFHVQVIFYSYFFIGIYFLFNLIVEAASKNSEGLKSNFKLIGTFTVAALIAILIQSTNLTQLFEYSQYSTRGTESIIELEAESKGQLTSSSSDFYQYATNWSFSPEEIMTFIIPSYYGFGNSTYEGPLTQGRPVEVNTYFGQMPFVDVAMYMGVVVFFLGLLSFYLNRKNRFVQFLGIIVIIGLLISFGRNLPILYDLMFYYFPFFDKFRVPSMILILLQFSFPILAGFALYKIVSEKEKLEENSKKIITYAAYTFSGLFVIFLLLNSAITDWFIGRVDAYAITKGQGQAQQFKALAPYMADMFTSDGLVAFALLALTFWFIQSYINGKMSKDFLLVALIVFTLFDLSRISSRGAKYSEGQNVDNLFAKPDYISMIEKQNDKEPYRMLNLKQDGSVGSFRRNSNFNAYFLQEDFYGYSAVKPRTYQDYIDVVGIVNNTMWSMLNVKYLIYDRNIESEGLALVDSNEATNTFLYKNLNAMPRGYFVDKVEQAKSIDVLNMVKAETINPKEIAFVNEDIGAVDIPDSTANVELISYKEASSEYKVNASGNNFFFFGNTYVPTGWKAFINGNETKIYKTNHGFMGILIPAGQHQIKFLYSPNSFFITKYVSLILSILLVIGLFYSLVIRKNKAALETN